MARQLFAPILALTVFGCADAVATNAASTAQVLGGRELLEEPVMPTMEATLGFLATAQQAQEAAGAAPAPAASPAGGPAGGIAPEVYMGFHRLFARDYFERWGHWSTGGPQLPNPLYADADAAPAAAPAGAPGPAGAPAASVEPAPAGL
eukprot:TRINITY_DN3619_c0_g1_i1.p1 TRINITY_DN3619_c0_g1~~TRINITY_DN3619_c0_g1_i1.p1  ORF type:complete len:149 (+),score=37.62 TRINITY_DN3619_c0_g1_i1:62-508(+)